jgi:tetratricopeptide (TPR) repeat protein
MNDFYTAIGSYTIAVESDTSETGNRRWTYPWAVYKLGLCYEIIGKRDRAEYYYNRVEEDDNERAFRIAQNRLNEPLEEIDISIIRSENFSDCGKFEIALESFQKLLQQLLTMPDPEESQKVIEIKYHMGRIKHYLQNYDEAIPLLIEVINESDDEESIIHWAHYYLGNCYKNTGKMEKAMEEYDLAGDTENYDLLNRIKRAVEEIEINTN